MVNAQKLVYDVPVVVTEADDLSRWVAIVENVQRHDLIHSRKLKGISDLLMNLIMIKKKFQNL